MEELRKLERVQRMLSFMEARGLTTTHQHSDRFIANFLLFLVQPSEVLNVQQKCDLISSYVQKIPATVIEEALYYVTEDCQQIHDKVPASIKCENELNILLPEAKSENIAKVGLDAMQKANSTLEDFCQSYYMFHGMDVNDPHSIFRYLPVLSFTESYIYQLDVMNEKGLQLSSKEILSPKVADESVLESFHETPGPDAFDPLIHLLQCQKLLTERIRTELISGIEYWELERKLCHALKRKDKIIIEDVMRAIHLKSFDYRVMNLLLYQLRGEQVNASSNCKVYYNIIKPHDHVYEILVHGLWVNDLHMEFLSISEFLVEISDDLYDYEDDVIKNSFNILRMLVGVYGASKAPSMLAKCITEAEEKYEHLSKALDPELSSKYWRRCQEAAREGGTVSGHAFGTWCIPPVIVDEESFRLKTITEKPSEHTS